MLDLTFIKKNGEIIILDISESTYENLIELSKILKYKNIKINIEEEKENILVSKLNFFSRRKVCKILEKKIHCELEKFLNNIDVDPTIKEIRNNINYLKELKKIQDLFKDNSYKFFSYE